jgi:polyisoprenoid-binding protein YceI
MQGAPLRSTRMSRYPLPIRGRATVGIATLAALLAVMPVRASAQTWRFDPVHSQVWFSASHQGFSNPQGRLHIKEGWFRFDPKDWASAQVDVVLDLASADLGDAKWNKAVQAPALLDVARHPTARYVSRSIERIDDRRVIIHGDLELRGTRQPVDVAFTLNRIGNDPYAFGRKAGFSASATLARAAFGITRYEDVVGATITLRFEIEGIAERDAAQQEPGEREDGDQE